MQRNPIKRNATQLKQTHRKRNSTIRNATKPNTTNCNTTQPNANEVVTGEIFRLSDNGFQPMFTYLVFIYGYLPYKIPQKRVTCLYLTTDIAHKTLNAETAVVPVKG